MKGAGPHFHIIGLKNDAALIGPVALKIENDRLKIRAHQIKGIRQN